MAGDYIITSCLEPTYVASRISPVRFIIIHLSYTVVLSAIHFDNAPALGLCIIVASSTTSCLPCILCSK